MRMTNRLFFALFLLIAGALSCKKESTATNPATTANTAKTPKETLIAAQWKKSQYKENGVVKPFFGSCEMDDILTFSSNGNYTMNDGTTRCSYTTSGTDFFVIDADNKTMRWGLYGAGEISFNSDKTSFTFKRTGANTFEYIYVKN